MIFIIVGDTAYSLDSKGWLRSQHVLCLTLDLPIALSPGQEGSHNAQQYELIKAALTTAKDSGL